jgi:transposase-like protein
VHNWIHEIDLQPESGKNPDHVVVDETVIRLNDEQYWLYAAVDPDTNELLYTTFELTTNTVLAQTLLTELSEKHEVYDAFFLIGGLHSLHAACNRAGYNFKYEQHGNRNAIERVFREIKHRTIPFSNCFSNATADTANDWMRLFSFASNHLI